MLERILGKKLGVKAAPATHGTGLFATRRFRAGQLIGTLTGKVIDDAAYGSNYCIDMGQTFSLEPDAPWRFVNHSCEPNAKLYVVDDDAAVPVKRRVILEALRNIQPAAEILIDYEWDADSAIPCGCGAASCRGWIVDPALLHLLKRKPR